MASSVLNWKKLNAQPYSQQPLHFFSSTSISKHRSATINLTLKISLKTEEVWFTFEGLLVTLNSFQHIDAELLKGFIGRGKKSVMSWLSQFLQKLRILK